MGYNSCMKKGIVNRGRSYGRCCLALCIVVPMRVCAAVGDLPVPILPDSNDEQQTIQQPILRRDSHHQWVIQLGAGNVSALETQAIKLRADYPDARVVTIAGQPKLVVGSWDSPSETAYALKALRLANAQAFVRQLPADAQVVSALAVAARVSATKQPAVPDVSYKASMSNRVVTPEVMPSTIANQGMAETIPEASAAKVDVLPTPAVEPMVEEDVLPAIVAVAQTTHPVLSAEELTLQAAADMLDGNSVMEAENTYKNRPPALEQSASNLEWGVASPSSTSEKRGIELPMRAKEQIAFKPIPLVEPLNLMLSPLYLLPTDTEEQVQSPQALTMKTVLEALVKPTLAPPAKAEPSSSPQQKATSNQSKLFARIAELANSGLWELALPLAKQAKQFDARSLSAIDHLLLGWVWLQNKEAKIAKGYFQASLAKQPQDEARYALGLSYLLLGDKASTQTLVKEMNASRQRDHLRQLLLR